MRQYMSCKVINFNENQQNIYFTCVPIKRMVPVDRSTIA